MINYRKMNLNINFWKLSDTEYQYQNLIIQLNLQKSDFFPIMATITLNKFLDGASLK